MLHVRKYPCPALWLIVYQIEADWPRNPGCIIWAIKYLMARTTRPRLVCLPSSPSEPWSSLNFASDGPIFPAKPRSEEREGGANDTAVGGPERPYLDAVGSLLLWVSRIPGLAESGGILTSTRLVRSWLAWSCDAIDFFSVSLTLVNLQTQFNRSTHDLVSPTPSLSCHSFSDLLLRARRHPSPSRCYSVPLAL